VTVWINAPDSTASSRPSPATIVRNISEQSGCSDPVWRTMPMWVGQPLGLCENVSIVLGRWLVGGGWLEQVLKLRHLLADESRRVRELVRARGW
jgi:hypothetical protein